MEKTLILDRKLQLELLKKMSASYPDYYDFDNDYSYDSDEYAQAVTNLYYLMQHNLVETRSIMSSSSMDGLKRLQFGAATINQNGLDFLADDGGLSAILNVVTVKFEADTLKAILENRINQSDLAPDDKKSMIDALRELPAESIKHLTMKLLDEGLENLPSAILLIGTYLGVS